jgi:hypothetical protein
VAAGVDLGQVPALVELLASKPALPLLDARSEVVSPLGVLDGARPESPLFRHDRKPNS